MYFVRSFYTNSFSVNMKYGITLLFSLFFSTLAIAQAPVNDECSTAIDLGMPPNCDATVFYTNVDATASDVGDVNVPSCFQNGVTDRDVWFTFTPSADIENYRITVTGVSNSGQPALLNPQIALYRGLCEDSGLAELVCASADAGSNELSLDAFQLTLGVTYFVRVNDYSTMGTPNSGAFNLCIEERPPINLVNEGGSQECSGVLYDTGGPDDDYGANEDHTYVICPDQPSNCINFGFSFYNLEYGGPNSGSSGDQILLFDGPDTSSPLLAHIGGGDFADNGTTAGGAVCFEANAASGCITVQFISDGTVNQEGFEATWTCSNIPCTPYNPITVDLDVTPEEMAEAIRAAETTLTVTDLNCPDGGFGIFTADNSDLGLGKGIILSSGDADYAIGPNNSDGGFSAGSGGPGDADLDSLSVQFSDGTISEDACILELDVFANTDELIFEYVFGSEEYPEFVNQFNDIFAFLISGPGIVGDPQLNNQRNIAVLPNPNQTVVQIDSVNNGFNFEYYRNNQLGESIQFDGLTSGFLGNKKSLTARAAVTPCNTYHLKLAVADRGDNSYDSGVFISDIRGGAPEASILFTGGIDYLVEDCTNVADTLVIRLFNNNDTSITYDLNLLGTATPDEDYIISGLPDSITFEPGENEFIFPVTILSDLQDEGVETLLFNFVVDFGCGSTVVSSLSVDLRDRLNVEVNAGVDTAIFCINDGVSLIASGAETYAWTPAEVFDDPFGTSVFATPQGDLTVQVVGALGNCTDTTLVFLREVDPMINILAPDTLNFCEGDTIFLTQENNLESSNITWSPTFGIIGETETDSITISPFFNLEYTVQVTLEGCSTRDSVFVDVKDLQVPTVISDTTVCESYDLQLANVPFNFGETAYAWTPGNLFADSTNVNSVINPTFNQEYTIISNTINGACPPDTQRVQVDVIPSRLEILNGDTLEVCAGFDPIVLQAEATPAGGSVIDWFPDGGGVTPSTGPTYTVQPGITVRYFATYTVNDCPQTESILVKVDSLPMMDIEADPFKDPFCQGDTFFLTSPIYDVGDFPGITHTWFDAPGLQTGDSLYNGYVIAQDTSLFFRVNSNGACIDTSEIQIDVVTPPLFSLTPMDTTICPGESVQFTFGFTDGSTGSVEWTPDDGSLSCTDCFDPIAIPNAPTEYMVEVTAEGSDCSSNISANINFFAPLNPIVPDNPFLCPGESIVLLLSGRVSGVDYTITGGGLNLTNPLTPIFPTENTVYTLTASNPCETVIQTINVSIIQPQMIEIIAPDEACVGDLLSFSAPTSLPSQTSEDYQWFINGSVVSTEPTFSIEAQNNVTVTVVYSNRCETITDVTSVAVSPAPVIEVIPSSTICRGSTIQLATSVNAATTTYQWTGTDGFLSTTPIPTVSPLTTTTYTVIASSNGACPSTSREVIVTVTQPYTLNIDEDQLVCFGNGTTIGASTDPEIAGTYLWTGPGIDGAMDEATINVTAGLTADYTVVFTDTAAPDGSNCFDPSTATSTVTVLEELPSPEISATFSSGNPVDTTIFSNTVINVTASDPPAGLTYTYNWSTNNPDVDPMSTTGQSFSFTTPQTGSNVTYNLEINSEPGGCSVNGTISFEVVEAEFRIPQLITPNGDGVNDGFRVFFNGELADFDLIIFNRWGQKVFQTSNPTEAWDGTRDGTDQAMDTYLYRASFSQNGVRRQEDGEFQLIR